MDGPDEDMIDYGTVGIKENRTITFKIINKNPVEVRANLNSSQHELRTLKNMYSIAGALGSDG